MKPFTTSIIVLMLLIIPPAVQAQLKVTATCPPVEVDLLDGKVNGLKPDRTANEITGKLPCFTSKEEENSSSKCGGLISYKDKDIYFYTGRNYVEIGPKFKGKMSVPVLGSKRGSLFRTLGNPKYKEAKWDAWQTNYGCLILYYGAGNTVNRIRFSTNGTDAIQLCE